MISDEKKIVKHTKKRLDCMFKTKRDLTHAIICFSLFTNQSRVSIQCEFEFDIEFIIIKILFMSE